MHIKVRKTDWHTAHNNSKMHGPSVIVKFFFHFYACVFLYQRESISTGMFTFKQFKCKCKQFFFGVFWYIYVCVWRGQSLCNTYIQSIFPIKKRMKKTHPKIFVLFCDYICFLRAFIRLFNFVFIFLCVSKFIFILLFSTL